MVQAKQIITNIKKTNFILFSTRNTRLPQSPVVKIDSTPITQVSSTKFLGIIINENLTWTNHIQTVKQKILKNIGIISHLRKNLPLSVLKSLYQTLVQPYFSYCNIVWGINRSTEFNKLFLCQKKVIRIITHSRWRSHSAPLFKELHILPLNLLNDFMVGCFMYICTHNLICPQYFINMFSTNAVIHNYDTRSKNNIHIVSHKLTLRTHTIRFYGPKLWNSLPEYLRSLPSLHKFKCRYKQLLLSRLDH